MYLIYTASKDTYITDKIIDGSFRATDANVGRAGTVDIFKLYDETLLNNVTGAAEISRGLIKFDLSPLKELTGSVIDLNSDNFKVKMKMSNLIGGTAVPTNFTLVIAPLSRSFNEGVGRDVMTFADLDSANFLTASVTTAGSVSAWYVSGANKSGLLNSNNIDYIISGTIDGSLQSLTAEQTFVKGTEDLFVDVTKIVSATLDNKIPDCGFRLSFTGSQENDAKTRFVKRFASVQSSNPLKKPSLHIIYDDSVIDSSADFVFDHSGSLNINNFVRGTRKNFISGAAGTAISGDDCMTLRLEIQDWSKTYSISQVKRGTDKTAITGLYSGSIAVSTFDSTLVNNSNETLLSFIQASGSVIFKTVWCSNDETVGFYTGSLEVAPSLSTDYTATPADLIVKAATLASRLQHGEVLKIAFFVTDRNIKQKVYKVPYRTKSSILEKAYYRIRDLDTGDEVIPFETANNGTRLSSDGDNIYFNLRTEALPRGRNFTVDLMIKDFGQDQIFLNVGQGFRVD